MKFVAKEKNVVMGLYFLAMACVMLAMEDNVPMVGVLNKVRYLYIAVVIFFTLYDGILVFNARFFWSIGVLVLHTILYGLVFVNPVIATQTASHFQQLIIMYIMVFFTVIYVYKHDCMFEFLVASFAALAVLIIWASATHFGDFVNPIYWVNIFSRTERIRACFGLTDVNQCGNYCLYTMIISAFLYKGIKEKKIQLSIPLRVAMIWVQFMAACMLMSTASRSSVIAVIIFSVISLILRSRNFIVRNRKLFIAIGIVLLVSILIVLLGTDIIAGIWTDSNREGNFTINYPIYLMHGDLLNGMGYADNSLFYNKGFGYETTAQDVYYLYIWFSTGYLGATLILLQMIPMLLSLFIHRKSWNRDIVFAFYLIVLYYAVPQVNYMNYRYHTGIIQAVILFYFLMCVNRENANKIYVIKK